VERWLLDRPHQLTVQGIHGVVPFSINAGGKQGIFSLLSVIEVSSFIYQSSIHLERYSLRIVCHKLSFRYLNKISLSWLVCSFKCDCLHYYFYGFDLISKQYIMHFMGEV
jgi:hypothetical protein